MNHYGGGINDLSMFDLFKIEVESQSAQINKDLLELENSPTSSVLLESVMRASHSLKGAARMVGVEYVVNIAHIMEDCFVAAQKQQLELSSDDIDVLLSAVDYILAVLEVKEDDIGLWSEKNEEKINDCVQSLKNIMKPDAAKNTPLAISPSRLHPNLEEESNNEAQVVDQGTPVPRMDDRTLRVDADRMTKILGMSSELLVESRSLAEFTKSLLAVKRKHDHLMEKLESWFGLDEGVLSQEHEEKRRSSIQILDECRQILGQRINLLDEFDHRSTNLAKKLYNEIAGSRMRPFLDGVTGFRRMVRDLARTLNKDVRLEIVGEECPVDRDVLEKLKAPLNHLLRNSVDHGIESTDIRARSGKPSKAVITLSAAHAAGMLLITVKDDGAGVDLEKLKRRLYEKGLVGEKMAAGMDESELLEFLFLPDFSTRDEVTELSGRGVGLDVVRDMVRDLGGRIEVKNSMGKGVKFELQLPLSVSVISALLVNIANEPYAFPLSKVDRILRVMPNAISSLEGRQYVHINGENIGLVSGAQILGFESIAPTTDELTIILISDRMDQYGVVVDEYIGQKTLSVHNLDERLGKIPDINSASLTESGIPLFIIDVDDMVRSINHVITGGGIGDVYKGTLDKIQSTRKRILVVEDSLTVREIEKNILELNGYVVDVAVDGMDGWNAVRSNSYDLVVTDVDMPRMDGIELVNSIKTDLHLKDLPVMIVSYKDRAEDRRRGLDAGADYYLAKGNFQDDDLVDAVEDLIGESEI